MNSITVVGSGATGVHFALSALKRGFDVTMLDVGFMGPEAVNREQSFNQLKCRLKDPVKYFLGDSFESVVPPDYDKEIYGFPPNKQYIFKIPEEFKQQSSGFEPLFSFAAGGLAQAWTGGSYPFTDKDLVDFPFNYADIEPYYAEISERIGVIGHEDDLSPHYPLHPNLIPPIQFDTHSRLLVDRYESKREKLNQKHGVVMGRSRVAVLSEDREGRAACDYSGRCLWGCPTQSLYVPAITLEKCKSFDNFTYIPHRLVTHFIYKNSSDASRRIKTLVALKPGSGETVEYPVETLVLAAGALPSSKIFLDSVYRHDGQVLELTGLMDNRQVLMPFINPAMLGKSYDPQSYQYHQLAVGFEWGEHGDYIHGQVTTLKTALMQPVLQTMPLDWHTATFLGRNLHSALGVVNMNYSDYRRAGNNVSIIPDPEAGKKSTTLKIQYSPPPDEDKKIAATLKIVKKFFKGLGVIVPPGQTHTRPMGASVHYSGTLPMSTEARPHTVSPDCRSHDFENLYVVDGASFPYLPAKNLTFSLMANAARVADRLEK